jgi:3-hydroxybutyryl-CoA dehydrogenase
MGGLYMIKNIAVLGAGTMGIGIAHLFAEHGFEVCIFEPNELPHVIKEKLHALGSTGNSSAIVLFNELEKAVTQADLIVEAVPEQLEIKREVYRQLAQSIKKDTIVASNTSTFSLETLSEGQPFGNRMIITHFFNPAHLIPLVEIVGLPSTSPSIINMVVELMQVCSKTPVVLNRDIPGFIANRLQAALLREACFLLKSGIANADQIDTVVKEGLGLRWAFKGPFEIADLGGLDIWTKVAGHLFPNLSVSQDVPESMTTKVTNGELGVKSGKGYYSYKDPKRTAEELQMSLQTLMTLKMN